jgi:hypothetical protein
LCEQGAPTGHVIKRHTYSVLHESRDAGRFAGLDELTDSIELSRLKVIVIFFVAILLAILR